MSRFLSLNDEMHLKENAVGFTGFFEGTIIYFSLKL